MNKFNDFTIIKNTHYKAALRHFFKGQKVSDLQDKNIPHFDYMIDPTGKAIKVECKWTCGPDLIFELGEIDHCWLPSAWIPWSGRLRSEADSETGCTDNDVRMFFLQMKADKSTAALYNHRFGLLRADLGLLHLTVQFNEKTGIFYLIDTDRLQMFYGNNSPSRYIFVRNNRGDKDYCTVSATFSVDDLKENKVIVDEIDYMTLLGIV